MRPAHSSQPASLLGFELLELGVRRQGSLLLHPGCGLLCFRLVPRLGRWVRVYLSCGDVELRVRGGRPDAREGAMPEFAAVMAAALAGLAEFRRQSPESGSFLGQGARLARKYNRSVYIIGSVQCSPVGKTICSFSRCIRNTGH